MAKFTRKTPKKPAPKAMLNVDDPQIRYDLAKLAHNHLFWADLYLKTLRADAIRKPADMELRRYAAERGKVVAEALKESRVQLNRLKATP